MTRDDIEALRTPLVTLAVTLLVAAGVILYSSGCVDDARRLLAQRETQLRETRLRIQNAEAEKELTARYARPYEELARTGFAGEEQRMNWLDGLRAANERARTLGVEYDIGAQRPYTYASEFTAGPLQLQESPMRLRLQLVHEEDLGRFLDALRQSGGGFFTVDRCVLRRLQSVETGGVPRTRQNIAAECELRWLTARMAGENK